MKRIFYIVTLCLLYIGTSLTAQTPASYKVSGKVVAQSDGSVVEMATIRLFTYSSSDSTLVQGAQTDMDGVFRLSAVPKGNYRLIVSSIGFQPVSVPVRVSHADVDVPAIRLKEDVQALAEVKVQGHAAEMTVKGDTIEYNTAAYKVQEGAMVEELLKKMNGVEVSKEGQVTVNGENITAVRVDGKKFFGNDVQSATKNIPADMIEKIQVIDEKSDMAKLTGFDDDEGEHIINLTLKKNRKKGIFGNYTGGLGADMVADNGRWFDYGNPEFGATAADRTRHFFTNDFRYNANIFTSILLGESQTTIIGSANNANEIRSGRGRGMSGGQNGGITAAENIGVNTNLDFTSKLRQRDSQTSMLFGGDVAFNHSNNTTQTTSEKESYTNGLTYNNNDSTFRQGHTFDTRVRLELDYQIDSLNKLILRPTISYTDSRSLSYNEYANTRLDTAEEQSLTTISDGYQNRLNQSADINAALTAIYSHKFLKPGRSLSMNASIDFTNNKGYARTYAWDNLGDSARVNQFTHSGNNSLNYSLKASYVEPIYGRNHFLETSLSFSHRLRDNDKRQYRDSACTDLDSVYSNRFVNNFFSEALEVNYRWVEQEYDLSVGLRVNPSQTQTATTYLNSDITHDTLINVWNFSPNFNFKYKFGKKEFARITYRGTTNQPSISQMEPVRNNSDAMNETVGNLNLNPAFRHNLRIMYSKFNQDRFSSIMTSVRGTLTKDALVGNSIYDETGKLYQQTVNATALPWDVGADLMYNTPFANKMLQFNTRTSISYNQRLSYLLREQKAADITAMLERGEFILGECSKTGNLMLTENLSLRFTHEIVDIGLRGNFTYSRTQNNLNQRSLSNVFNWTVTGDVAFHLPKQWNIGADCGYTARYGYNLNDVNEILLNASVDKSWTNATLSLKVYDILNNRKNVVQVVGENYVQYKKVNSLPTYFMLTFTYKLNKMGDLKAKGAAGFMQDMIEQGGSQSGRGPMPPMSPRN
ncbi:MAG: outer membrane beta-barrel protein [Paludibacteraceae bacterium]|nr:outer membrane beta-barrel protein [Paludibacteraceae bacterium]